jgi:hypothetical protein
MTSVRSLLSSHMRQPEMQLERVRRCVLACAALFGVGTAACGSVVGGSGPGDAAVDGGKTGILLDAAVVDGPPPDAPPPMLCVAPASTPPASFRINLFTTADGRSGPDSSCAKVGSSFTTTNPQSISCRRYGGEVRDSAGNYNHWWLWTQLDQPAGQHAWISAYYIKNEGNDEAYDINTHQNIAACP